MLKPRKTDIISPKKLFVCVPGLIPLSFYLILAAGIASYIFPYPPSRTAVAGEESGAAPPTLPTTNGEIRNIGDLEGKRLGVLAGTILDNAINDALDFTQIIYFDDNEHEIAALLAGEIDAIIDDDPVVRYYAARDPRLRRVDGHIQDDNYAFATRYEDKELHDKINRELLSMIEEGVIADLEKRWLDSPDDATRVLPDLPEAVDAPVLRLGVSSVSAPFCYVNSSGRLVGLDIELMERLSRRIGMRLVITDMEFSRLIPSLLDGDMDIIGSCFSITEERRKMIDFTSSYYVGGVAALALEDGVTTTGPQDQNGT